MGLLDKYINKAVINRLADIQRTNLANLNSGELLRLINGYNLPTLDYDNHDYYNAYRTIGAVYETTDLIASKINSADILVYTVVDQAKLKQSQKLFKSNPEASRIIKAKAIREVTDHEQINKILNKPNDYMNKSQFIESLAKMYMLRGNAFVYGAMAGKRPTQLIPFADMQIIADHNDILNPIRGYEYIIDGYEFICEPHEMYHLKTGNPKMITLDFQHLYGVSPLSAYLEPMRTIKEANEQASKQMKNGGKMQLISPKEKEDQLGAEQRLAFKEAIQYAHRSDGQLSRLIPASFAVDVKDIGLSSAELQLIEQKRASSEDVYRAFHVPLHYFSSDNSSYNNLSTAVKQLIYDAVSPISVAISQMLTDFVGKPYGDYVIEIDLTTLPEMASDMGEISKWMYDGYELGVFNQDEVRLALSYDELGTPESQRYEYKKRQLNNTNNNGETSNQNAG